MIENPLFLVAAERSGTTVLRLMFDHHPKLAWCSNFAYAIDPLAENPSSWPDLDEFHRALRANWVFQSHDFQIDPSLEYPGLVDSFLEQLRERSGKAVVGAVVHRHFDQLTRIWPQARFIHLVRDPRDVARSCIGMGWAGNVWSAATRWVEVEETWRRMEPELTKGSSLEVRYERLIGQPEQVLREICDFAGFQYDDAMLDYSADSTYPKPDASLIEQWKRKMTPFQIRLVESRVGGLLSERGYEACHENPQAPGPPLRYALSVHDRAARVGARIRRLGWSLYLKEITSRRLGLTGWRRKLEPRLKECWQQNLR